MTPRVGDLGRHTLDEPQDIHLDVRRVHLEIKALRARAEDEPGKRFDLRAFHDDVLRHGAIPLSVLRRVIDRWIRNRARDF